MAPALLVALPYIAAAGSAVAAGGAVDSGMQQAAVDRHNAAVQRADATNAMSASQSQASMQATTTERQQGQIGADYGAAGVTMTGSPLAVMSDQAAQGELRRQLTLYRGKTQQQYLTQQAGVSGAYGRMATASGLLRGGSTLLTGAGNLAPALYSGTPGSPLVSSTPMSGPNGMASLA